MATEVGSITTAPLEEVAPACIPVGEHGIDRVEGAPIDDLVTRFGSPLWVVSKRQLLDNFVSLQSASRVLGAVEIAYSVKANNNRAVLQTLVAAGASVDCSSEFELQLALDCGVPASRIILNGNGKSSSYLHLAAQVGVRQVNVDSVAEVRRLEQILSATGGVVDCVVRVKLSYRRLLAVDPSYERTLRVAEAKFGSSVETGEAHDVVRAIEESPHLTFRGLSHHAGFAGYRANYTPSNQLLHVRECAHELAELASGLSADGIGVERLDVGGGLRSGHHVLLSTPGGGTDVALHPLPTPEEYVEAVRSGVAAGWTVGEPPLIQFETGGFQVANAVVLLTTVQDVKDVERFSRRRFVTVDTAMTMFTARGSTRVGYPVVVAGRAPDAPLVDRQVEVVGQTCAYDSIAEDITLPEVGVGDVLVLLNQGAYAEVTSTQFNGIPRPAVVMVDGPHAQLVRRRETSTDIFAREMAGPVLSAESTTRASK